MVFAQKLNVLLFSSYFYDYTEYLIDLKYFKNVINVLKM